MLDNKMTGSIPPADADRLIAAHDGDVALLYIYIHHTGCTDLDRAAKDLCRTMSEISAAEEKLRRLGLMGGGTVPAASPALEDALPSYRAEDIARRSDVDPAFSAIVAEARTVFGSPLSTVDMQKLFGIYDYLNLPADVIFQLLHYCADMYGRTGSDGSSRKLSMRSVEKEAYVWVNREILTLEQADEYIQRQYSLKDASNRLKPVLGIHGREYTGTEKKYVQSWIEMGFGEDAVAIAYDRTVTNTGSLRWSYMNKILLSWHEKNLHTPQDIEAGDSRKPRPAAKPASSQPVSASDIRDFLKKS